MKALFTVEKTNTGYSAHSVQPNGTVATIGDYIEDLRVNALEAYNLYLKSQGKEEAKANNIELEFID